MTKMKMATDAEHLLQWMSGEHLELRQFYLAEQANLPEVHQQSFVKSVTNSLTILIICYQIYRVILKVEFTQVIK